MSEQYEFTRVNGVTEPSGTSQLRFRTDAGKALAVQLQGPGNADAKLLRRAAAEREPVFVAFDPASNQLAFAAPIGVDHVRDIQPYANAPKDLRVTLVTRPSYLRLRGSHPRFAELRRVLEAAAAANQSVWVGTYPGDADILDARLAPQAAH